MKKITFKALKKLILDQEIAFIKESNLKNPKQSISEMKEEFNDIKNIRELVSVLGGMGFKDWEAYEYIIKTLVKE